MLTPDVLLPDVAGLPPVVRTPTALGTGRFTVFTSFKMLPKTARGFAGGAEAQQARRGLQRRHRRTRRGEVGGEPAGLRGVEELLRAWERGLDEARDGAARLGGEA